MNLFKKLFGDKEENIKSEDVFEWIPLTDKHQLEELVLRSGDKAQFIFKHSTRCGISSSVLHRFEKRIGNYDADFYYLDLLAYRDLSHEISDRFNVIHQSPQLIVIKNGKSVLHNSHYEILELDMSSI